MYYYEHLHIRVTYTVADETFVGELSMDPAMGGETWSVALPGYKGNTLIYTAGKWRIPDSTFEFEEVQLLARMVREQHPDWWARRLSTDMQRYPVVYANSDANNA